jgi:hypothetical protein
VSLVVRSLGALFVSSFVVFACSSNKLDVGATSDASTDAPIVDGGRTDGSNPGRDASSGTCTPAVATGMVDAGTCSGPGDAGRDGGGGSCAPGSVSTFASRFHPPTGLSQGKCTEAQTSAFVDCLNSVPDAATCKTFVQDAANKNCIACADTPATAASYGPLVSGTVTIQINVSGCVALLEPCNRDCAVAVQDVDDCEALACEVNCPVSASDTGAEFQALLRCQTQAGGCGCRSYADKATCLGAIAARRSAAAVCQGSAATFADNAKAMVRIFCGT